MEVAEVPASSMPPGPGTGASAVQDTVNNADNTQGREPSLLGFGVREVDSTAEHWNGINTAQRVALASRLRVGFLGAQCTPLRDEPCVRLILAPVGA